jgi:uncharacterized CHY-type Zn-finger protein
MVSVLTAPKMTGARLRSMAIGQACTVRLPGCTNDPETVVGAHVRRANTAGMGQKPCDLAIVYACSNCHDVMDGRVMVANLTKLEIDQAILHGLCRTLAIVAKFFGL